MAFAAKCIADVATWPSDWKELMFWSAFTTCFIAVLSPVRTFGGGGDAEIVLQLLLGWLLAAILMLLFLAPLWSLLFSPVLGCVVVVIGNAIQRRMWDHMGLARSGPEQPGFVDLRACPT